MSVAKQINIETLWDAFLKGDDKAFAGIYYAFVSALLSYGRKLTPDNDMLHDTVQEIFMDVYLKRNNQHNPIFNIKAYLFIALKNSLLRKLVNNRKYDDRELDDTLMGEFRVEYSFEEKLISYEISEEKRIRLQQAIVTLSSGQKEIIYLKFEEGLSYSEIAELMNITIESARKQLYRALLSLRHILDSESFMILFSFFRKKD